MKKFNLIVLAFTGVLCTASYAIDNDNPFVASYEKVRNQKTEPTGVSTYSFKDHPNMVTEISEDKAYLQEVAYTKSHGFAYVADARVTDFDQLISGYKEHKLESEKRFALQAEGLSSNRTDFSQYSFARVDIENTLSGENELLLESPGGNYLPGKGWDSSTKIVNNSELGRVVISEWHYAASNGGVIIDSNAVNHYINGNPAVLIIRIAESGRAETVLSWADDQKSYTIQIDKNVSELGMMQSLSDFAENISNIHIPMQRPEY